MIKSESLVKLAPALVKAQKNMGAALKDAKNPFFKSSYANLNAVIEAAVGTLNDEGIAVLQTPQIIDGASVIQTVLLHESGEFIASNTAVTAAKVNDPQAAGSAISYARRYGLQATVTLRTEEDDGEAAMGRGKSISSAATVAKNATTEATATPVSNGYSFKAPKSSNGAAKTETVKAATEPVKGWT